jgi:hypothetical protein
LRTPAAAAAVVTVSYELNSYYVYKLLSSKCTHDPCAAFILSACSDRATRDDVCFKS